jgi:hypothetical protein
LVVKGSFCCAVLIKKTVHCIMANKYKQPEQNSSILNDDGADTQWVWEPHETAQLQESLKRTHAERFHLLMRMMRIGHMLSHAKVIHKKID